jgi:UDP-N-acetylglucosamine acyltransferase
MSTVIHETAIIDKGATIGADVIIGPYSIVQDDVVIGDRCEIGSHVSICSGTRMGAGCRVFKGGNVGEKPQDLKFGGEKSLLRIGENCTIREFCTLNRGTKATGETVIGSNCLIMAYGHVGHDCRIGDYLVAANTLNLAGHVEIGHHVNIGGISAVAQFRKIGDYCHIGAYSLIIKDVIPFSIAAPAPSRLVGLNSIGLVRAGFSEERRRTIKRAYKTIFRSNLTVTEACARLAADSTGDADVENIIAFVKSSTRGLLRMKEQAESVEKDEE